MGAMKCAAHNTRYCDVCDVLERPAPEATRKPMETLKKHNELVREMRELAERIQHRAGVACDKCGTEMLFTTAMHVGTVRCPNCGETGNKLKAGP